MKTQAEFEASTAKYVAKMLQVLCEEAVRSSKLGAETLPYVAYVDLAKEFVAHLRSEGIYLTEFAAILKS